MCRNKINGFKMFLIMKSKRAAFLKPFGVFISFGRNNYFVWTKCDFVKTKCDFVKTKCYFVKTK